MKKILVGLAFTMFCFMLYEVKAGPPEGMERKMIPMSAMCLTVDANQHHFGAVVGALQLDYSTHIAYTFDATPDGYQRVAILLNPETKLGGVVMVTPLETCIIFSGQSLQSFERGDLPPPKVDLNAEPEEPKVES